MEWKVQKETSGLGDFHSIIYFTMKSRFTDFLVFFVTWCSLQNLSSLKYGLNLKLGDGSARS